jgi:hypothetical protein
MEKKRKQLILIGLLVPVLGYVVYSNLINPEKKPGPSPAAETPPPAAAPAAKPAARGGSKTTAKGDAEPVSGELPPLDKKLLEMQSQTAAEPWGRDPFNPAPTPMEGPGVTNDWKNFRVTGLIPGPAGGVAVINGTEVVVGDSYRGYLLIEIDFDQYAIILEKDGQECRLEMPQE